MTPDAAAAPDPRERLGFMQAGLRSRASRPASYVLFDELAPSEVQPGMSTWYARGQNFVVGYSRVIGPATAARDEDQEWILLVPEDGIRVRVDAGSERTEVDRAAVMIVPPGESTVALEGNGVVVSLLTASSPLAERASNGAAYDPADPNVVPFHPSASPHGGYRLLTYSLHVPPDPDRFGNIWRSSGLMLNVLPMDGPRDPSRLSPHHHDDFEQGSLALEGEFIQHLRWPWTADIQDWREDDHVRCPSPSLTVIPPPAEHTTQAVAAGRHLLIDIFSPPRSDFASQPGWVLNEADYPPVDAPDQSGEGRNRP